MAQKYSIQLLTASTDAWMSSQYVIPNGELVAELRTDNTIQLKIGNGLHKFSDLPYVAKEGPKGDTGDPLTYDMLTDEQKLELRGKAFTYEDFTDEQLAGLKGETGHGLIVKGTYDTQDLLEEAITSPEAGDAYAVGAEQPYDIYIYDGINSAWVNFGQLQGVNGVSPTITASKTDKIITLTITDVDGTEIVTINEGTNVTIDSEVSDTSENPVQNKVIKSYIDGLIGDIDSAMEEINGVIGGA